MGNYYIRSLVMLRLSVLQYTLEELKGRIQMAKTDISVRELVDKINRGELRLPEMQRRYVWPATRVRDLFDSLYRGYPSGTILAWSTDENIEDRDLAVGTINSPTSSERLLLLDGQQRLTSLTSVLSGRPVAVRNRMRPIEILFNLEHPEGPPTEVTEVDENNGDEVDVLDEDHAARDIQKELRNRAFVVGGSKVLDNDPLWVKVSDIFSKPESEILRRVGINSDDPLWDKYSDRLQKVRAIEQYQYVMHTLDKSMDYEEVTEIFVRVNSLGVKLRSTDLALAQITSKWRGFMSTLEDFASSLRDKEDADYVIEKGLAVRLLNVFATKQSRFNTIGKVKLNKLEEAWEKTKPGLEFAINFAKNNAGYDYLQYLSSPFLLVPLAVYYELKDGHVTEADEKVLLQWMHYAHLRSHYSGSAESTLDTDLNILFKGRSAKDLFEQLRRNVKKLKLEVSDVTNATTISPIFSTLYVVLRQKGAKDWVTGLTISHRSEGQSHLIQYHHIFPKSLLQKRNVDSREINEIANMAFIGGKANRYISNKEPIKYLDELIEKHGSECITTQLVPLDKDLWTFEHYGNFLTYRRKAIVKLINDYVG